MDSVAAAISYKVFKQSSDEGLYLAAAAGGINDEAQYVLSCLEFENPHLVKNVGTKVDDILVEEDILYVTADMTVTELGNLMRMHNLKTVPVLDEHKKFLGLVTIGDLAMIFMDKLGGGHNLSDSPEILRSILEEKVSDIMKTRDLMLFEKDEPIEEVRKNMLATRFRNYPVVDESNHYLGMISRYNLLDMKRKKLILVDHNEKNQAVDGVEEAEILEIVDHHRVGDVQTISPIYFHNEPVGSTCTLVAEKYLNSNVYCSRNIAALMMAGILSDTMLFKSPTTTPKDRRITTLLQEICSFDPMEWGKRIIENTGHLEQQSDEEIIKTDLKEYVSGEVTFAIAQVETIDMERFAVRKTNLLQAMQALCRRRGYSFMCLMVTDIMEEGTELLVAGDKSSLIETAFGSAAGISGIFLKGVMSRKKQVVPIIYEALRKKESM